MKVFKNSKLVYVIKNGIKYIISNSKPVAPPEDIPVTGINIEPSSSNLEVGQTLKLTANIIPPNATNKDVTWSSGNSDLFNITNDGVVTGINQGSHYVYCTSNENSNITSSAEITIVDKTNPPVQYSQIEVPTITTYYFNPKPFSDEEVIIPIYVSDFYQEEYYNDDYSLSFKIRKEINGNVSYIDNVKAGDNTINLGILQEGNNWFSLQVEDEFGRVSHRLFNELMVVNRDTYPITSQQTYNITQSDLDRYLIKNNNSEIEPDLTNTKAGLTNLFKEIRENGYRKCVLLPGTYRISKSRTFNDGVPENMPIQVPSSFTVDLNGATIKQHQYDGSTPPGEAIAMIQIKNCIDSHLINGTLEGDYAERQANNWISGGQGEHSHCADFRGGMYNSMEDITVKNVTGYTMICGFGNTVGRPTTLSPWADNIYTDNNGNIIEDSSRCISNYSDISSVINGGYNFICASVYLAFGGRRGDSFIIDYVFYDENKNFLETIRGMQYRYCRIPDGAKFVRVSGFGKATDFDGISVHSQPSPRYCSYKNIESIDNRTCWAPFQFNNLLMENVNFTRSGQSITPCAIDLEDGWEQSTDFYMKNCKIKEAVGTADLISFAGLNHVIENCDNWRSIIKYRINGITLKKNTNCKLSLTIGDYTGNTVRLYDNEFTSGSYITRTHKEVPYKVKLKNNSIKLSSDMLGKPITTVDNCNIVVSGSCKDINVINSDVVSSIDKAHLFNNIFYTNCTFNPGETVSYSQFSFNTVDSLRIFKNCIYNSDVRLIAQYAFNTGLWDACTFKKTVSITPTMNSANSIGDIQFNNCTFDGDLTINLKSDSYVQFNKCIFNGSIIYQGSAKANCQFNDNIPNSAVQSLRISAQTYTVKVGKTVEVNAWITPANAVNRDIIWTSSSESIATIGNNGVDKNGLVAGVSVGSATITGVTTEGNYIATCIVNVTA